MYRGDLFEAAADLPRFDLVFSLGLIEHFTNIEDVIAAHLRYLRPGGTLMVGCPNFRGLNYHMVKGLAPSVLDTLDVTVMDADRWDGFERRFDLTRIVRGYIGGFEPIGRCERQGLIGRGLGLGLRQVAKVINHPMMRPLRKVNSKWWSAYLLGVYRGPVAAPRP